MRRRSSKFGGLSIVYKTLFVLVLLTIVPLLGITGSAASGDAELAQKYAPIFYFEQSETCYPVDISYHLNNSYLCKATETGSVLITQTPTAEEIANYSLEQSIYQNPQNYYLDNQRGTIDDTGIITDYKSRKESLGYTVYAHVYSSGATQVVQYWVFYAFNDGELNKHEGDWEMVQVVISSGTPTEVMYSQHYDGQRASWNQVERDGDHFKVYVARGSHANYLRSYSGKLGMASDIVGDDGIVLKPGSYSLVMLESQPWLDFAGRWGWYGGDKAEVIEATIRGNAGPQGPKYRADGNMWNDPVAWGGGLSQANDNIFLAEWFLYNFVTLFIVLTAVSICISVFFIYRRHKKNGLGPRIVSMFYIDGFNLKSIGNILCFVGIFVAVFSLFYPWYAVSSDINVVGYYDEGMIDMIKVDGINGVQITIPGSSGPVPFGSLSLPFSLLIGIGLAFLFVASIGIAHSKKLGRKYIWRGVRLLVPVIMILVVIMALGMLSQSFAAESGSVDVGEILGGISSSPFGGQKTIPMSDISSGVDGQVSLRWGLGLGGFLLMVAGIILIVSGVIEIAANTQFFEGKMVEKPHKEKRWKSKKHPPAEESKSDVEAGSDTSTVEQTSEQKNK